MRKNLLIIFILCISASIYAQNDYNPLYRNVFIMHGMNGDANSMTGLADYFSRKYNVNVFHPAYITTRGIAEAANNGTLLHLTGKKTILLLLTAWVVWLHDTTTIKHSLKTALAH